VRTSLIVAANTNDVISSGGKLPWDAQKDLNHFRQLTTGHVVIVGHQAHISIMQRLGHVLPERVTIVLTRAQHLGTVVPHGDAIVLNQPSMAAALTLAKTFSKLMNKDEVFVIGGAQTYTAALPYINRVYLTRVHEESTGDRLMPRGWLNDFTLDWSRRSSSPQKTYSFEQYERKISSPVKAVQ
jgi:dihydrofolate reductase